MGDIMKTTDSFPQAASSALPTAIKTAPRVVPARLRDVLALDDFERHCKPFLPRMIYQYVAGGVETETAMRNGRQAYQDYGFTPRALVDTSARSTQTSLFGKTYSAPFSIGPLGGAAFVAYRADLALAAAAYACNIPMILSASSLIRLEDVIAVNPDAWFQGYLAGDFDRISRMLDRVEAAGYKNLVVTVDTPILGNREHNIRTGFAMPIRITPRVMIQSATHPRWLLGTVAKTFLKHGAPHFENTEAERGPPMMSRKLRNTVARDKLTWGHIAFIRKRWKGPLIIKGIISPHDAIVARDQGADGIILSNHGGRQLDHAMAPLRVLPEVAARKGDMKVIVDGGIRRGSDVLKALALGADFTLMGRPFLFAAAYDGRRGVEHAYTIMRDEIMRNMAMLGVNSPSELNESFVRRAGPAVA
ncbi:alpha-hydroxy acid oxidase [Acetobacter senegalensis]|uniref:alpha-hydroxy acid oxidase n=1 Tax=Acetobacter senegalensis TaxID=446692 RepID=UPI001EDA048A|nr:alpha-hydroxy acid oxidase [Acetobacter senegalensis]